MINQQRIERTQARMREKGIDAYLILTHDDYIYLLGKDRHQPRAIILSQGLPINIAFRGEEDEIRSRYGVDNVRVFGTGGTYGALCSWR